MADDKRVSRPGRAGPGGDQPSSVARIIGRSAMRAVRDLVTENEGLTGQASRQLRNRKAQLERELAIRTAQREAQTTDSNN